MYAVIIELISFVSVPNCNLIEIFVPTLLYLEVVEAVENALVSFCSSSGRDFECLANNVTNPSSTISCEASFERSEIIVDNELVMSSSCFDAGVLDTSRYFPPRSIPSSINSLTLTNTVSGIIDQSPGLEICKSPDK